MKLLLLTFLGVFVLTQAKAQGKMADFRRVWVSNPKDLQNSEEYGIADGYLRICPTSATWEVFSNQLNLMFIPKMKGDTLLLIYRQNDVGRGFSTFKTWPIVNKPFAKLYHAGNDKLGIIYLNKSFVASVKKWVNGADKEKKLIFPSTLFLHKKQKANCEDENTL